LANSCGRAGRAARSAVALPLELPPEVWHLLQRVAQSALAGAFGAVVAAMLSCFTEPVLNRVAVKRISLVEALREVRFVDSLRFFRTALATNLLKFPFFEAVYAISASFTGVSPSVRGVAAAVLYTTAMLPLSNYRYMMSLQMKVSLDMMYQAYWPTLLRDLAYGVARTKFLVAYTEAWPYINPSGHMFLAIGCAMLASSPFNELRAFCLQPADRRLSAREFFRIPRFLRSAVLGAFIPATAIAVGQLLVVRTRVVMGCLHVGLALWILCTVFGGAVASLLVKLERARLFYDPYSPHRLLRRFASGERPDRPADGSTPTVTRKAFSVGSGLGGPPAAWGHGPSGSRGVRRRAAGPPNLVAVKAVGSDHEEEERGGGSSSSSGSEDSQAVEVEGGKDESDHEEAGVPTWGALLRFVAPAFCLVVANSSMSSVDKAFMGHASTLQLAAMGPATAAFDSSSYLLTFLNTATLSLLTAAAGDAEQSRRVRSHAVAIAAVGAVFLAIVLWREAAELSIRLGATPEMLPYSVNYLRLRALGAPIERGASVATSFCLAAKDGVTPLLVTVLGLAVNIVGDGLLVARYGLQGVAIASVFASAVGYAYLIRSLRRKGLWPEPFSWPRGHRDVMPFLRFAGPVLFAVFLKTVVLANMTAAASALGTAPAAAHQIFSTLFLLSAVALGNPFSWAAQAFLPPLLREREGGGGKLAGAGQQDPQLETLARLFSCALVSAFLGAIAVMVFCRAVGSLATSDPLVLQELDHASLALMPFTVLYPVLLTLEGALYGAERRGAVLVLSLAFWVLSSASLRLLRHWGLLTLSSIWVSSGVACGAAVLVTAGLAVRVLRRKAQPTVAVA